MKKSMIISGSLAAAALIAGISLKYAHAAGAGLLLTLGMLTAAFVFMPFLYTVWVEEKQRSADKAALAVGILAWMSQILAVLFKIQHWPGATILFYTTPVILIFLYLPIYFFAGSRNAATMPATIARSILIIIGCGLFFSLTITPRSGRLADIRATKSYLADEQILRKEVAITANTATQVTTNNIYATCETLKSLILQRETGYSTLDAGFESKNALITDDHSLYTDDVAETGIGKNLEKLSALLEQYNSATPSPADHINVAITDISNNGPGRYKVSEALRDLINIQMALLQNMARR